MKALLTVLLISTSAMALPPGKRLQNYQKQVEEQKRLAEEKRKEDERIRLEVEKRVKEEHDKAEARKQEEAEKAAKPADPASYTRPVGDPLSPPIGQTDSRIAAGTVDAHFQICWDKDHNWFAYVDMSQGTEQVKRIGGLFDAKSLKLPKATVYFRSNRSDDSWRGYSVESPALVINGPLTTYVLNQPGSGAAAQFQATSADHVDGLAKFTAVGDSKEVEMFCKFYVSALSADQLKVENLKKLEAPKKSVGDTAEITFK